MNKKTFLHEEQLKLKAKMVDFAGWEMPVQYQSTIMDEHKTVREKVGLFDVSHMGEVFVSGRDSLAFLQKLVPQNVSKLVDGKAIYCQLLNKSGGIIDDLIIYKLEEHYYLLIVNASRIDEDLNWMVRNKLGFDVEIDNQSHNYSLLAIQGPKATDLVAKMGLPKDKQPEFFTIKRAELSGVNVFASRTGYTGEDGFEIMVRNECSQYLWNEILEKGQEFGIKPIGLGARDTLRLEVALHLYGNDLNEDLTPIDVGLKWSVSKTKQEDYNGKDKIFEQMATKPDYKMIGFKMTERAIPRHEYKIFYGDEQIGYVSSGGVSPTLSEYIGLGIIKNDERIKVDSEIEILIRDKKYKAKVVKKPFVDKKNSVKK